jgi:hypothetical protein
MRRRLLRLRVGQAAIHAEACHHGQVTWAGEASYQSLEELTDAIARLASEPATRCRRLLVTLERPPVQIRMLSDLPPVKGRELTAVVAHQAARYFRRNGHPLVTDAQWVPHGSKRVAQAAAVEEPVVEAIVAGARAAGLALDGISPADLSVTLLLLPNSERAARTRTERARLRRLGFATALVWISVVGLLAGRLVWERRAVERQLNALQAPLAAVLAARRELHEAESTVQAVAEADAVRRQAFKELSAVTAVLPDSAVLTWLTWSGDSGLITGFARRTSEIMARLERNRDVPSARLEGPVTQEVIAGRQWERFTIVFGNERGPP